MKVKYHSKRIYFIVCFLSISIMLFAFIRVTHAAQTAGEPNYIIMIDRNGNISSAGNLFGNDLWYPGKEESGVIRIISASPVKISKFGFDIHINSHKPDYSTETIYRSFINQMKLSLQRGRMLVFKQTLLDSQCFSNITSGLSLDKPKQLTIQSGNSIDLKYTLYMSDEAGEELEQVSANVKLIMDLEQPSIK